MRGMTRDEFITKARAVHGDKYDYSKVVYVNQSVDVIIICPEHGEFLQRPNNHYMGAGCPLCTGNHKMTTETFIKRAREIHGDKYDYSKSVYVNSKTKLIISCPEHGDFEQSPDKHLSGHGCPMCAQSKVEATNLQRYGVKRPLQNKEIHEKSVQTCLDKYGVRNPMQSKAVLQKQIATNMERYGVPFSCMADSVKERRISTCKKLYNGASPFSSVDVRRKAQNTIMDRYSVANVAELQFVQNKICHTNMERYGVPSVLSAESVRNEIHNTCLKKYGAISPLSSLDVREKINAAKQNNGTFSTSEPENIMYSVLRNVFGTDDVKRQYKSVLYPYMCDFYIKSRDLYIELNASWIHGFHWFSSDDMDDMAVLQSWKSKHTLFYDNAVQVWTERDVAKRNTAKFNKLNYITFWNTKLLDFYVWISMDCPDGHDYDMIYSWLPVRELHMEKPKRNITISSLSQYAKYYHQDVFYAREKSLWKENPIFRKQPLQMFLYQNRQKYLGKSPEQLTDFDILRGFSISGVLRCYTAFDARVMERILKEYSICSVADPCAGWGERLLCCYLNDVEYHGYDINQGLLPGYTAMIKDFQITKQSVLFADASTVKLQRHYDAVITCPPYHNIEIYTENGAENLSYTDFLSWWEKVVQNFSDVKYFCFQINQKYKSDMAKIVLEHDFSFVKEILPKNGVSHFHRKNGAIQKQEYESMLVFQKCCS